MRPPRLSVVVPTLDEEAALSANLPPLFEIADEVVVSDGESRDRTREIAAELGGRLVTGPAGRGGQLNRGAAVARGEVLLFLHADTRLPDGAGEAVKGAIAAGYLGGGFLFRFDLERPLYRLTGTLVNLRTRLSRLPLGDQGQFASAPAFRALGGFRDWPILEDLDFARRLRRQGKTTILPLRVTTSARRYASQGLARTALTNWLIWSLFLAGAPPRRLARLYRHIR